MPPPATGQGTDVVHDWDWISSLPDLALLMASKWPSDPSLPWAGPVNPGTTPSIAGLLAVRSCSKGGQEILEAHPYVQLLDCIGRSISLQARVILATAHCSGWRLAAVLEGMQSLQTAPSGDITMNVPAALMILLMDPVQLRLVSVQPLEGSLSAWGGGILLRMSHQAHAKSRVQVTLHSTAVVSNGTAFSIMWVKGIFIACSTPPGIGTVYVCLTNCARAGS